MPRQFRRAGESLVCYTDVWWPDDFSPAQCLPCIIHRKPFHRLAWNILLGMNKPNRSVAAVAGAVAATFSHIVHMLICPVCVCARARPHTHTHAHREREREHSSPLFNPLSRVRTRSPLVFPVYEHGCACARLLLRLRSSPALWNLLIHRRGRKTGCNNWQLYTWQLYLADREITGRARWRDLRFSRIDDSPRGANYRSLSLLMSMTRPWLDTHLRVDELTLTSRGISCAYMATLTFDSRLPEEALLPLFTSAMLILFAGCCPLLKIESIFIYLHIRVILSRFSFFSGGPMPFACARAGLEND